MTKRLQPVVITTNSSFGLLNSLKKRFPESSVRVIDAGKNVVMWLNLWLQRLNAIAKFSNLFTCCIYCVLNRWLSPFALSYLSWSILLLECLGLFFFLIINLFQEKKSSVFNESPLMANPALFNVDAEDGLYCPLQIRHLDLDFIAFQG